MAKKKIKIIKRQFKEIRKLSLREIKPKEEEEKETAEENVEEEKEEQEGEKFAFDDFSDIERKAPSLEPTGAKQEELENMLGTVEGRSKEGKEAEEKDAFKYDFEKPKYSLEEGGKEGEAMEEIRHVVLKETPVLIEKTPEARKVHNARINEPMLEHFGTEEYVIRYVKPHEIDILKESEEVKGKKVDIKKYRKER